MLLEGIGAAAAGAGGIVLTLAIKRRNSANRTVTSDSISSSIVSLGDVHGNATMTVGAASPAPGPGPVGPPSRKPRLISVPLGIILIVVGLALIGIGAYWD